MKIGVLGSGQLGRMLALSAYPLGHQMSFLASSEEDHSSLLGNTFIQNGSQEIMEEFPRRSGMEKSGQSLRSRPVSQTAKGYLHEIDRLFRHSLVSPFS